MDKVRVCGSADVHPGEGRAIDFLLYFVYLCLRQGGVLRLVLDFCEDEGLDSMVYPCRRERPGGCVLQVIGAHVPDVRERGVGRTQIVLEVSEVSPDFFRQFGGNHLR